MTHIQRNLLENLKKINLIFVSVPVKFWYPYTRPYSVTALVTML